MSQNTKDKIIFYYNTKQIGKALNVISKEIKTYEELESNFPEMLKNLEKLKSRNELNLLFYCIINNNYSLFKGLISLKKFDLNEVTSQRQTLLHYTSAYENNGANFIDVLLTKDVDIIPDDFGQTPLHIAAKESNVEACKLLLEEANSIATVKDKKGKTALEIIVKKGLIKEVLPKKNSKELDRHLLYLLVSRKKSKDEVEAVLKYRNDHNNPVISRSEECQSLLETSPSDEIYDLLKKYKQSTEAQKAKSQNILNTKKPTKAKETNSYPPHIFPNPNEKADISFDS
ncbi:ankyrin repeat domain-containing protein [Thiotrichales bacterium 19S9-12]|nr:ankyrin repeat domain-containing protein [Thiotrichales bacterium 19S9-11]MCF6812081.1 ankyrin repeat domain-containing protein [Thiotrichales bacterium 19S9-12]